MPRIAHAMVLTTTQSALYTRAPLVLIFIPVTADPNAPGGWAIDYKPAKVFVSRAFESYSY